VRRPPRASFSSSSAVVSCRQRCLRLSIIVDARISRVPFAELVDQRGECVRAAVQLVDAAARGVEVQLAHAGHQLPAEKINEASV